MKKICIDPGHGGHDPGAVGPSGLEEASVNLTISEYLVNYLDNLGLETQLTREDDSFIELSTRCEIANQWEADYFISIHMNSDGPTARGVETLFCSDAGKELALPVQNSLVAQTGDTDRGLKYRDDLYVLNGTNMPAILVECGFISHPETEENFKDNAYRRAVADAIGRGIGEYLALPI